VLADGSVLTTDGFDQLRGIDFRVQPEVLACVPELGSVTDNRVEAAMRFLSDEWLVDVAANYAGKCIVTAAALTIIERSLLDQRPAFFVTSGRRGGGKDHDPDDADQGGHRHLASSSGVVNKRGGEAQGPAQLLHGAKRESR
jgi:hypothetical protein